MEINDGIKFPKKDLFSSEGMAKVFPSWNIASISFVGLYPDRMRERERGRSYASFCVWKVHKGERKLETEGAFWKSVKGWPAWLLVVVMKGKKKALLLRR